MTKLASVFSLSGCLIYGLSDTQLRVAALSDMMTPLQIVSLSGK